LEEYKGSFQDLDVGTDISGINIHNLTVDDLGTKFVVGSLQNAQEAGSGLGVDSHVALGEILGRKE